jgi:hypothetical protein
MKEEEHVRCRGHRLVSALHQTTFEVTTTTDLTPAGDCIIGIGADKGASDLSPRFRELLASPDAVLVTTLSCGDVEVEVISHGGPGLTLNHPHDLVWRRSTFTCDRTIGILSDRTARTLPGNLVKRLKCGDEMEIELVVTVP